jgi:hypothetical protein
MKKFNSILLTCLALLIVTVLNPVQASDQENYIQNGYEILYVTEDELQKILSSDSSQSHSRCATCTHTISEKVKTETKWVHFGIHPKYTGAWQYTTKWGINGNSKTTASAGISVSVGGSTISVSANFNIATVNSTTLTTYVNADSSRASKPTYSCYATLTTYKITERRNANNAIVNIYYVVTTSVISESVGVVYRT